VGRAQEMQKNKEWNRNRKKMKWNEMCYLTFKSGRVVEHAKLF
jgi:glutathione peroxidase-family protein